MSNGEKALDSSSSFVFLLGISVGDCNDTSTRATPTDTEKHFEKIERKGQCQNVSCCTYYTMVPQSPQYLVIKKRYPKSK